MNEEIKMPKTYTSFWVMVFVVFTLRMGQVNTLLKTMKAKMFLFLLHYLKSFHLSLFGITLLQLAIELISRVRSLMIKYNGSQKLSSLENRKLSKKQTNKQRSQRTERMQKDTKDTTVMASQALDLTITKGTRFIHLHIHSKWSK